MAYPNPPQPNNARPQRGPLVSGLCILAALFLGGVLYSSIAVNGKDQGTQARDIAQQSIDTTEQYKQSIANFLMSVSLSHANGVMAELDRGLAWIDAGSQKDYTQVASTVEADANFTESYREFNQHLDDVNNSFAAIPAIPDTSYQHFTDTATEIKNLHDAYTGTLTSPAGTYAEHDDDLKQAEDVLVARLHEAINEVTTQWPEFADTPTTAT